MIILPAGANLTLRNHTSLNQVNLQPNAGEALNTNVTGSLSINRLS